MEGEEGREGKKRGGEGLKPPQSKFSGYVADDEEQEQDRSQMLHATSSSQWPFNQKFLRKSVHQL